VCVCARAPTHAKYVYMILDRLEKLAALLVIYIVLVYFINVNKFLILLLQNLLQCNILYLNILLAT